ncbi:MAG: DUF308 domain-containing protein [Eubacteriaceae bacterium]|nr:DUF308 domain-containing protein [Eubacteriaceae bacterium]
MLDRDGVTFGMGLLNKVFGRWWMMLLEGVSYIVIAVLALMLPGMDAIGIFVFLIGIQRIVMGSLYILLYFKKRIKQEESVSIGPGRGIFNLALGAVSLMIPNVIVGFFIIIIGIWSLSIGIGMLFFKHDDFGVWRLVRMVIGVLLIVFGLMAFLNSGGFASLFTSILAVIFIGLGLYLINRAVKIHRISKIMRQEEKGFTDYKVE